MRSIAWRRVFPSLTLIAVLALLVSAVLLYPWQQNSGEALASDQSRLGPAPSLSPEQIQALTTQSGALAAPAPRAAGQSRADVVNLFNTQYTPSLQVPAGWTGSVAGCVPGNTSVAFETATIQMANYFRTMAGLPTVTLDPARTAGAQSAALMMKAQNDLSHAPPPTWACFTQVGADSAGKSNLALGNSGASAVVAYVDDTGVDSLGHRRWVIFPSQVQIGTGSTDTTNALDVTGGFGPRPATPETVTWPPAGFVPFQVVYSTWSLALPNGDFSAATITMTSGGVPVPFTLAPFPNGVLPVGFGDNAIGWRPQGLGIGPGVADKTFTVTVGNVGTAAGPRTFTYDVTVIDPALGGGPPASTPTPTVTPVGPAPTATATATTTPTGPCAPRPRPTISTVSVGAGRVQTTITATGAGNTISSVRIGVPGRAVSNASVTVQGLAVGNGATVTFPGGATQVVLTVTRTAPGAATVPYVLVDNCGDWPSFVGMGTDFP